MKFNKHSHQKPIVGEGWKEFSSICIKIDKLDLGPHAKALLAEMIVSVKVGMPIVVIILAATIVDVIINEQKLDLAKSESTNRLGVDWLTIAERKQLEWLRGLRNRLLHYQGVISGMGGSDLDQKRLRLEADKALKAISPLLEGLEQF